MTTLITYKTDEGMNLGGLRTTNTTPEGEAQSSITVFRPGWDSNANVPSGVSTHLVVDAIETRVGVWSGGTVSPPFEYGS